MIGGLRYIHRGRSPVAKVSREEALSNLDEAIDKHERKIAEAFRQAVENIKSAARIELIAQRIEDGDVEGAVNIFRAELTQEAMQPLAAAISGAAVEGARVANENLKPDPGQKPIMGPNGRAINFEFGGTNPRLAQFAEEISATRIREVGEDVRQVVRSVISEETVAGTNPIDTARRVRESIGLTERQERSVDNFRRQLELASEGNQSAITEARSRELRDKRFSIKAGMTQEQIDKQVSRYRERFIRHRSEVIGRTESIRAINGASHELMRSYVDEGRIDERQVRRKWIYTKDDRTRADHRTIPAMNPNGVGLNEPFQTPLGPLMYPGDPQGVAENVIQCRCNLWQRVVSMELIEDQETA